MIAFLTSSPCSPGDGELTEWNGLRAELLRSLPARALQCVYIAGAPDTHDINDLYARLERERWERAGFAFSRFHLHDDRQRADLAAAMTGADLLILAGGHVPTQNAFYRQIGLRDVLQSFGGVLFTISAGTMNMAETVYALPEWEGEAVAPGYRKFYSGLGLTDISVIPHWQEQRHMVLDGMRILEDIACPDSVGRCFIALPDGSYLLRRDGHTELRGEAYRIENGIVTQINRHGDTLHM